MLGPDDVALVELGFEIRDFEDFLGLLRQWYVAVGQGAARAANRVLDGFFELEEVTAEVAQDLDGNSFSLE